MGAEEFKVLYLPYQQKLYRVAYRILENAADAEDIIQEAYIKLWNKRDELSGIGNYGSYCAVLVKNLCLDFLRSDKRYRSELTDDIALEEDSQPDDGMELRNDLEQVEYLIGLLPEQQKKVLILRHYDGYSMEEIEEITGLNGTNIRVLLSRGRKKLRELFTQK